MAFERCQKWRVDCAADYDEVAETHCRHERTRIDIRVNRTPSASSRRRNQAIGTARCAPVRGTERHQLPP